MSLGNYDGSVSTVADKPGSVEATQDSVLKGSYVFGISNEVAPSVPEVSESVGRARLHLLGVASGINEGLFIVLHI